MAADQHRIGVMDDATYRKITVRHLVRRPAIWQSPSALKRFVLCVSVPT